MSDASLRALLPHTPGSTQRSLSRSTCSDNGATDGMREMVAGEGVIFFVRSDKCSFSDEGRVLLHGAHSVNSLKLTCAKVACKVLHHSHIDEARLGFAKEIPSTSWASMQGQQ